MSDHHKPSNAERDARSPKELSQEEGSEGAYPMWWVSSPALSFFVRHQRLISAFAALLMMSLLAGGLMISQISARHGLLVFSSSPERWSAGSQAALRVEARALSLGHRAAILNARVRFESPHLPSPEPQSLTQGLGLSLQGTIQLPERPGKWRLLIEAEAISAQGARGEALKPGLAGTPEERALRLGERVPLRATLELTLLPRGSGGELGPLEEARTPDLLKARDDQDTAHVKSFAAEQRLSFELPSELLILSVDEEGSPLYGELQLSVNGEPQGSLSAQPMGITAYTVTPRTPTVDLHVSFVGRGEGAPEQRRAERYERHWPEAHQFGLTPSAQLISDGGELLLTLKSTQAAEALFVDLWWEGRWLSTEVAQLDAMREGRARLKTPPFRSWDRSLGERPALLWAQAYQSPYQPGEVRGGRYLLYQPPQMSARELGRWLLSRVEPLKVTQSRWPKLEPEQWVEPLPLRLLLGRIERPQVDPLLIINSVASAEATAEHLKAKYQGTFLIFMAGLCLGALCFLAWLMMVHQRSLAPLRAELNAQSQALSWFIQVALILLCFFGGMVYLVYTIRW